MGSGKSRLGKRLAPKMNRTFIDLDQYIVEKTTKTIPEIFQEEGEEAFRRYEYKYLQEIGELENHVVACGGGTPCYINNKAFMKHNGVVLFLTVELETLTERLWKNRESRPLIAAYDSKETMQLFITTLLQERTIFYNHAHMSYDNTYPQSDLSNLIDVLEVLLVQK